MLPVVSFAQITPPSANIQFALPNELGVEIIPTYPRPNEMVLIRLTLYTDDLSTADITWFQDSKSVLSGKGETKYTFRAGPIGQETDIEVKIKLLSGTSFSKTIKLNPASVDLVWEADSYVPPFYEGKALHPRQGLLKIVAMPEFVKDGKRIPPESLTYNWSNNDQVLQDGSGYGKNVLILNGSILGRPESINVLVTDPVNNLVAQKILDIAPVDPQIVFYQNDPYYGYIFDSAITNTFNLKSDEVQILAAPYYFTNEISGYLQYQWQLNGQTLPDLSGSRTAIFKKPEGKTGQSVISLQMTNANRVLQQADNSLTMSFSN